MRTITIFALACLTAPQALLAQVYTEPAGYVSLTVPANSDSTIGHPLFRASEYAASGNVSGAVITVTTNLVTDQFVYAPPTQPKSYFLLIKTAGAFEGRYFDVIDNSTTTITLDTDLTALGAPASISFEVIPFHTLNSLFPSGAGVGVSTDIFEPLGLVQVRSLAAGVNRPIAASYFYYQGTEEAGTGWYNNDNLALGLQNNATIDPYLAVRIRNLEASAKTVTISGTVPSSKITTPIVTSNVENDNYLSVQHPVNLTLAQSGLAGNGVRSSTDIFEPVDLLMVYNDDVTGINKPLAKFYFHYVGTEEAGTGWYDNDNLSLGLQNNQPVLKAGRTYVIRRAAGTPGTVIAVTPLPY